MVQLLYSVLFLCYSALFVRLIFSASFFAIAGVKKMHLAFFFVLKVAGGLVLTSVYTFYYTDTSKADIYRYFIDSKIISSLLFTHPLVWLRVMFSLYPLNANTFQYLQPTLYVSHPVNDFITSNTLLIKIISLLNYFSFYNIFIDTLLLNCITFTALVLFLKGLTPYFKAFPQILYWPLFLLPSVVFWSSGLLKEALLFTGVSLYLSQWLNDKNDNIGRNLVISAPGFLIVGLTKVYVAVVLFACSILLPARNVRSFFVVRAVVAIALCLGCWFYFSHYPVCQLLADKRNEFVALSIAEHSSSALDTMMITPDCDHIVGIMPSAMVNAVLRPFIWENGNMLQMLFAIENLFLMVAVLCLLLFYFKVPESNKIWLALFCFSFAALNYSGIGITVPVLGAIVHYRVVAVPFLLLSVLLITDLDKLRQHLTRLKVVCEI